MQVNVEQQRGQKESLVNTHRRERDFTHLVINYTVLQELTNRVLIVRARHFSQWSGCNLFYSPLCHPLSTDILESMNL